MPASAHQDPAEPAPTLVINHRALNNQLLGTWAKVRREARERIRQPELQAVVGLSMAAHRQRVSDQVRLLAELGATQRAYPKTLGGQDDHGGNLASFEELFVADPSLQIKAGVQWGLFGAAVLHLGTEQHHRALLPAIMSLKVPGVFAMTETGHGSDVQSLRTVAVYDPKKDEFVLNSPDRSAWKDYLGNAAIDGLAAVVFAQLITRGQNHGVHAFYVPIRTSNRRWRRGVGGEDNGLKGGLNGLDNGRLHFTDVRVPRNNLLNRYGSVSRDGTYNSPIANPGRRFFTMLGTLVQGRVSLDGTAVIAGALGLTIAVRYGNTRHQFLTTGSTGKTNSLVTGVTKPHETLLLDYQHHQRRLIPRIAAVYAAAFAHDELLVAFERVFSATDDSAAAREDLETRAAALKPVSTWATLNTLQECRETCGGAGFLAENRLTSIRADFDVYTTFEGDNTVLLLLVARRLLADYSKELRARAETPGGKLQLAAETLWRNTARSTHLSFLNAVDIHGIHGILRGGFDLGSAETQARLLREQLHLRLATLAQQLHRNPDSVHAHQSDLVDLGRCYGELLQWEAFAGAVSEQPDSGNRRALNLLLSLFGLGLLEKDLSWFLLNGRLSARSAQKVRPAIDKLLVELRPVAEGLVDAFGFAEQYLRASIAQH